MIITLPYDFVAPDEESGQLPAYMVGNTTDTWIDIVNYWNAIGYFMVVGEAPNTMDLRFPPNVPWLQEKNAFMTVPWWNALCDTGAVLYGEVRDWQAVWQVHPQVYDQGYVPLTIPNSVYIDQDENPQQRLWKQWGSPYHTHYYLPVESDVQDGLTLDRYFIPTWSWGVNILGTEMMFGQKENGVNLVSREDFQKVLNQGGFETVPVTPV